MEGEDGLSQREVARYYSLSHGGSLTFVRYESLYAHRTARNVYRLRWYLVCAKASSKRRLEKHLQHNVIMIPYLTRFHVDHICYCGSVP